MVNHKLIYFVAIPVLALVLLFDLLPGGGSGSDSSKSRTESKRALSIFTTAAIVRTRERSASVAQQHNARMAALLPTSVNLDRR
jgi:hypothetical protein